MIDVSTLGGLEVRGPDAAELLERIYTFAYAKQPVGRTRYLLACDLTGAIIDDGVACRFAEDWFYVTATTSGVDALYRSMLRWNAEWRLDVDIANVTAAYAGINVAGPLARAGAAAARRRHRPVAVRFPYLACREGDARRHPGPAAARRLRGRARLRDPLPGLLWRGAVGPAGRSRQTRSASAPSASRRSGPAAGEGPHHRRPGHGRPDLPARSPAWIGRSSGKKPFFVGQRAIQVQAARPLTRKLVGFTLPLECAACPRSAAS